MTKLVLLHKAGSIYDDEPDARYDFPRQYLKAVEEGVGDWAVYYEPAKAGPRGCFAVARIASVIPKPGEEGRYLALIEPGTYLSFDVEVPRLSDGRPFEAALQAADGSPKSAGMVQSAVRRLPEAEFVCAGLGPSGGSALGWPDRKRAGVDGKSALCAGLPRLRRHRRLGGGEHVLVRPAA
jgi:putative restriction endonuclease